MPPRIPITPCLRASKASPPVSQFALPLRPFSATTASFAKHTSRGGKKQTHDPYVIAQKARQKAANLSRRADLEAARVASLGDPVRGNTTPFVESFAATTSPQQSTSTNEQHLNYALRPKIVEKQLGQSEKLAVPLDEAKAAEKVAAPSQYPWAQYSRYGQEEPQDVKLSEEEIQAQRKKDHERATEAIKRITALDNGSSKDRMRVNIARCVSTFGRHNTDRALPPRAPPLPSVSSEGAHPIRPATNVADTKKRIGADTGSSEVQIAILTAKIKTVADFLQTRGKGDKHNKRNLRLLVHRRQKLLQYLRRKERGGPRWQHCIETLGLTEGTWKGEISL